MTGSDLETITTEATKEYALYQAKPISLGDRLFRSLVFGLSSSISWLIRNYTTEHFSIDGLEDVFNKEDGIKPPYLLLVQHTTWFDFSNIFPVWFSFPAGHHFTALTRKDYFPKIPVVNAFVNGLASAVSLPVYGISSEKAASAEEIEKRNVLNKEVQEQVIAAYAKGISVALAPEGTSKGNGRISPIRSGAYHYSYFVTEEGLFTVPCVPIGVTYDFLSGKGKEGKRKQRVFARVGQPFMYAPVSRIEGEAAIAYQHRDKEAFNQCIRDAFIDLNTITAAQLASVFIYDKLKRGQRTTTFGEFQEKIHYMTENLVTVPGICVDPILLDQEQCGERLFSLYHALIKEGYLAPTNFGHHSICQSRALREPSSLAIFKKENMLLHTYNKIAEMMEQRDAIRDAIAGALR